METPAVDIYEFGGFQLDPAKRLLRRLDGTPVPLTPRVFETLLYMVEHHDSALDKERIMEAVWPDSIVEENNLDDGIGPDRLHDPLLIQGTVVMLDHVQERFEHSRREGNRSPVQSPQEPFRGVELEPAKLVDVNRGSLHRGFQKN